MPERPFSRPNSPSVRIVPRVDKVKPMQPTTEPTTTETIIDHAERQRRWLRRFCWTGFVLAMAAILFVVGHPLFVRWQLRQHGWSLIANHRGLPGWVPSNVDPWLATIDEAQLHRKPLRDVDLTMLRQLPQLREIMLIATDVTESKMVAVSQLPEIELIEFQAVRLESAGLRHLATHRKLKSIAFYDTVLEDSDLEVLSTCHQLKGICLTGCTDANLRHLSRLHRLETLWLLNCRVTDDGAKQIADGCPSLKWLSIANLPMTDAALLELVRLPNLRQLDIDNVPITDDGIQKLKSCVTLRNLSVKKTAVTSAGATELRKSLPGIGVSIE